MAPAQGWHAQIEKWTTVFRQLFMCSSKSRSVARPLLFVASLNLFVTIHFRVPCHFFQDASIIIAFRRWPYRVECTGSLSTSDVKQHRAQLVLGWASGCCRLLSSFVNPNSCRLVLSRTIENFYHFQKTSRLSYATLLSFCDAPLPSSIWNSWSSHSTSSNHHDMCWSKMSPSVVSSQNTSLPSM